MDIRDRIRFVLDRKPDLTMRSVSLAAGLSDSMLHKFLNGSTRSMTVETLEALAKALGVDARWLIFGDGDMDEATEIAIKINRIPQDRRAQVMRIIQTFLEDAA